MPHVCPPWIGRLLLCPGRKVFENPQAILGPYVRNGMTVLEPGCAMGYFTLPLARMVGPNGRVVALDVQQPMLDSLSRRAGRAGLADRIDMRLVECERMDIEDLAGAVDFAAAINVVHETPDPGCFLGEIYGALKPGRRLLIAEPGFHVSAAAFRKTMALAAESGFSLESEGKVGFRRLAVLERKAA
ncbi:MAG: class I SAM-dependent methyltransferase [Oceanidesulfovibrio sp.]